MEVQTVTKTWLCFILADNGLNPVWWVKFDVDVINPPLAYLRFVVNDEDMFGEPNFIGHAIFPMCSLKTGMYLLVNVREENMIPFAC